MNQEHGGNISTNIGILDFSANINPLGIPGRIKKAVTDSLALLDVYPDPFCTELTNKLAVTEDTDAENIVCGNGASDLIYRIVHALKPRRAVICAPTFSEYKKALSEVGCETAEHSLKAECSFDLTEQFTALLTPETDICFLCTPNNPTGRLISPSLLRSISEKCRENDIILVCDESFLDFVINGTAYSLKRFTNEKCVILKAFTKLYAIPGIRLGYAVCGAADIAAQIRKSGQYWSVSALAQAAGLAALDESGYAERTARYVASEREFLISGLKELGIRYYGSAANYILLRSEPELAEKLLREKILIRDCRNFSGLGEGYYRIAVRQREENILLLKALGSCKNG